jgi:shikimate dehydrogenase
MKDQEKVTKKAGVIGFPIEQSLSPVLHNAAYKHFGLDNYHYDKYEVTKENLADFINALNHNWLGFSITMPLKQDVIPYLDSIDKLADQSNAVNTVVVNSDLKLTGYNTDIHGIIKSLECDGRNIGKSVVILGSGATARSAYVACKKLNFEQITVLSRHEPQWSENFAFDWRKLESLDDNAFLRKMQAATVISALPWKPAEHYVLKLYQSGYNGMLLECAFPKVHERSIDGSIMLTYQAIEQIRLMTNKDISFDYLYCELQNHQRK